MGVGDVIGRGLGNRTSTVCRQTVDMGFVLIISKLLILGEQWPSSLQIALSFCSSVEDLQEDYTVASKLYISHQEKKAEGVAGRKAQQVKSLLHIVG